MTNESRLGSYFIETFVQNVGKLFQCKQEVKRKIKGWDRLPFTFRSLNGPDYSKTIKKD